MKQKIFWYEKARKDNPHEEVFETFHYIKNNQSWLSEMDKRNLRLYGEAAYYGADRSQAIRPSDSKLSLNIIESMVDTATNKISKNKVKPSFLTDGGNWFERKKGKLLNKYIEGQFYSVQAYKKGREAFPDACIWGSCFLHPYRVEKEICVERVMPEEIIVDETEAIYGEPRNMYRWKIIHRQTLIDLYPKFKAQIKVANDVKTGLPSHQNVSDMVMIVEAWHLPSGKDGKDGRHFLGINNCTLVNEEYKKNRFPFVKFDWKKKRKGYRAKSLAEELMPLQLEINKSLIRISRSLDLCSVPRVYLDTASSVVKSQLTNEIGSIVWYEGNIPTIVAPTAVSPDLAGHLENMYRKSFEKAGISQLAAQSKKPDGLDSGKALREFSDIESERFATVEQNWEEFYLDLAKHLIDLGKEIAEEFGDYSVMVKSSDSTETISWKEIDLDEDKYIMQVFPTAFLSKTPSGKLNDVKDLAQAGLIEDKDTLIKLLDWPDLESYMRLKTAAQDNLSKTAEDIIEKGIFTSPEPFQNLQMGLDIFNNYYLWARNAKVPEKRLEQLRRWMAEANVMIKKAQMEVQSQQMAAQPQQGMNPLGAPAPQAVSPLLPVA